MAKQIKITLPNGKAVKVTGETIPTEQELNEIFRQTFPADYENYMQEQAAVNVKSDSIRSTTSSQPEGLKAEIKPDIDEGALSLLFLEGLTFNLSDEAISFVNAATDSMFEDVSFGDAYKAHRDLYKERIDAVKQSNPMLALGAEMSGAIVSPINFMGKVSATRAAIEAGVAGFGSGQGGVTDRIDDAAIGATIGAIGHKVLEGAGGLYDKLTKTKLERLAQESGEQIPITLARPLDIDEPDSSAQNFYRTAVYPSFAGGKLRADEGRFIRGVEGEISSTKSALQSFTDESKVLHEQARKELKDSVNALDIELKNMKAQVDIDNPESAIKGVYSAIKNDLSSGARVSNTSRRISEIISADEATFRKLAFEKSMPSYARTPMGAEIIESMNNATSVNQSLKVLDDAFTNHGFSVIKNNKFVLTSSFKEDVLDSVKSRVVADIDFDERAIEQTVKGYLKRIEDASSDGVIDGAVLAKVRADLGSLRSQRSGANVTSQQAAQAQILGEMQGKLDELIQSQLPKEQLGDFLSDKEAWKHLLVLRAAVLKRSGGGAEEGMFTPADWADANKTLNPKFTREGVAPLYKESTSLIKQHKKSAEAAKVYEAKLKKRIEQRQAYNLGKLNRKISNEKTALENANREAKANMSNRPELLQDIANNQMRIDELNGNLAATKEYLTTIKDLQSTKKPTLWHTKTATGLLGGIVGLGQDAYSGVRTMIGGTAVGIVARDELAQRIAAKQTAPQEFAQKVANFEIPNPLATVEGLTNLGGRLGVETPTSMTLREGMLRVANPAIRAEYIEDAER
jgi:hypothetical protein